MLLKNQSKSCQMRECASVFQHGCSFHCLFNFIQLYRNGFKVLLIRKNGGKSNVLATTCKFTSLHCHYGESNLNHTKEYTVIDKFSWDDLFSLCHFLMQTFA